MLGFSRLEILLMVLMVSVIGASVLIFGSSHRPFADGAGLGAGEDFEGDNFSASGRGGPGVAGSGAAPGTNAEADPDRFNEKSMAIALPGREGFTNGAAGELEEEGAPGSAAGKQSAAAKSPTLGDIESELNRIAALPWGPETEKQLQAVLAQWAATDPAAALAYALKLEGLRAGTAAVGNILAQWARSDPAAAFKWFNSNFADNPQVLKGAAGALFAKMAEVNPVLAMDNAWQLLDPGLRGAAVQAVVSQMMAAGQKDQLLQYFNAMSDTSAQGVLARAMVDQWATYYPEMTAEWIAGLRDPSVRNAAAMALIAKWGGDNPARAAAWISDLPRDGNWSDEVSRMVKVWSRDAPDEAASWLLSLSPPAAQLDPAVRQLVHTVMNANPEGAMVWANAISATDQRHRLMQEVGYIWMRRDPVQAANYIMSSDMPDWMKQRLLRRRR